MDIPLPMPFSLISSPIQTRNMVPAVMVVTAANVGSALPPVKSIPVMPPWLCTRMSWP